MKNASLRRMKHYYKFLSRYDYWTANSWKEKNAENILCRMVKEGWNPHFDNIEEWYLRYNSYLDCDCIYYEDETVCFYSPMGWLYVSEDTYNKYCEYMYFDYINDYLYSLEPYEEIEILFYSMEQKGLLHNHIDGYDGRTHDWSVVKGCNTLQLRRYIRKLKKIVQKHNFRVTNEKLWKNLYLCTIKTNEWCFRIYY